MQKHVYTAILFSLIFCLKGFGQAFPPVINSYTDTVAGNYADLYLNISPNDTGIIKIQIQLQQGTGNNVYDSTYYLPAGDTTNVDLRMEPLNPCSNFDVLINLSNDRAQGQVINPLFSFTTICTGLTSLNENNYSVIAYGQSVEIKTTELPQSGTVEIYDITGRQILNAHLNQLVQQIPFNKNAGIYLLRITGNNQRLYTTRFVIN
jgi:hypothetical protein